MPRLLSILLFIAIVLAMVALACDDRNAVEPDQAPAKRSEPPPQDVDSGAADPHDGVYDAGEKFSREAKRVLGGRMITQSPGEFSSLNPLTAASRIDHNVLKYHLVTYLLTENPELVQMQAWLAQSLPTTSPDGLTHTWTLRKEATWSDGKPLTSADVVFTWDLLNTPNLPIAVAQTGFYASVFHVDDIRAIDERRFEVHYQQPFLRADFDFGTNFAILPRHACPAEVSEAAALDHFEVGSGAYRVKSWNASEVELERMSAWWG
ncbi:MAG: hypothetical protein KDB53_09910, partial [Planctomycetes bacterium]|nr:hypothetical protein [Planctomycetota bacterium]